MYVVYLHPHFTYPGGAVTFVLETAKRLVKQAGQVSIIAQSGAPDFQKYPGIKLEFVGGFLNFIKDIRKELRFRIPAPDSSADMPTNLPKCATGRGFKFNYYIDANLYEYDVFFTIFKDVIHDLEEMDARNVHPPYSAPDTDLFKPLTLNKEISISFFDYESEFGRYE